MKITLKERKPRNHLVALLSMRNGAGRHEKSKKAKRRADKMNLRRECGV